MNRVDRGIQFAIDAAKLSINKFKVGAALFKGNTLISVGWNNYKTHPASRTYFHWQHAELNCFVGVNRADVSRLTLYVVRINNNNQLLISKPCSACHEFLKTLGLRKVWYINRDGCPRFMRIR